ncbi:MAG: hypothetical protein LH679_00465 [Cyanobacteria bacterium CAN_BIN43]|nr:hypothetical protein [Cyanobacteria bacterium CAN_BIN43]
MPFEIIHKSTFTNQLLAIPKERVIQILEKIEVLRDDPKPHGSLKKKLQGYKGDIYRLRSGDFRIIYTYGDQWVALLGVDACKDVYKGDKLVAEEASVDVSAFSNLDALLVPSLPHHPTPHPAEQPADLLPAELTPDLLDRLLIPKECFPILLACRTFDALLEADVPGIVRDRLFDCITAPNFDQVLSQPNFITGTPDELLRFKEGDLFGFLLKLNAEQEKFVTWAINATGPTLLKGGPGTGKSTVALYRTREILQQLKSNTASPRILFTTLNTYAQEYENLKTIHEQLLSDLQQAGGRDSQIASAYQYATEALNASPGNFQTIYSFLKSFGFTQKLISDAEDIFHSDRLQFVILQCYLQRIAASPQSYQIKHLAPGATNHYEYRVGRNFRLYFRKAVEGRIILERFGHKKIQPKIISYRTYALTEIESCGLSC